jgi:hypothetical protein
MLINTVAMLFVSKCLSMGVQWQVANQNLDLAMLVVQRLQDKYISAKFIFTYFTAAFERIAPSQRPGFDSSSVDHFLHRSPQPGRTEQEDLQSLPVTELAQVSAPFKDEEITSLAALGGYFDGLYDAAQHQFFTDGRCGGGDDTGHEVSAFCADPLPFENAVAPASAPWPNWTSPGEEFDALFGADGIYRGLEEFDLGELLT